MSKIEEVARAIYATMGEVCGNDRPNDWDDLGLEHEQARKDWMLVAIAAIRALREPDEGMIQAGVTADTGKTLGDRVAHAHRAMIDSILSEEGEKP